MSICRSGILFTLSVIAAWLVPGAASAAVDAGTWHAVGGLGDGCSGTVWAETAAPNGDLYVGGAFRACGDAAAASIARWDGSHWSALGAGTDGTVFSIAVAGSDVYVAGLFSHAGDVAANNIARWDGSAWHALGSGIEANTPNGLVNGAALAIIGTDVYVGGVFDMAGGAPANGLARWDSVGETWSTVGTGLTSSASVNVNALVVFGGELVAGGNFDHAGGIAAGNVASWNGSTWSTLGSGVTGTVMALAVSGSTLYAGGTFSSAGGIPANQIAAWSTAGGWASLGSGSANGAGGSPGQSAVLAIAVGSDGVYAGGQFTFAGGVAQSHLARWDGSAWSGVGGGIAALQSSRVVRALAFTHGKVYAGGAFNVAGSTNAHFIAAWDGATWSALTAPAGNGIASVVYTLANYAGETCAGSFWPAQYGQGMLVCSSGGAWSALGGTPFYSYDGIEALAAANAKLYVGYYTPYDPCCLSYWNGSAYNPLGAAGTAGMDSDVLAILPAPGGGIYAAGDFTNAGTQGAGYIAYWDGAAWQTLGTGLGPDVNALALFGGKLYAGGTFVLGGGGAASQLAVWDGMSWTPIGNVDGPVFALLTTGDQLYVGGSFTHVDGGVANGIARWNGTTWSALATGAGNGVSYRGVSGAVLALASKGGQLYLGGQFDNAGGVVAGAVARWDGTAFASLGGSASNGVATTGLVYALSDSGVDLVVGGQFGSADGQVSADVARYTPDDIFDGTFE